MQKVELRKGCSVTVLDAVAEKLLSPMEGQIEKTWSCSECSLHLSLLPSICLSSPALCLLDSLGSTKLTGPQTGAQKASIN